MLLPARGSDVMGSLLVASVQAPYVTLHLRVSDLWSGLPRTIKDACDRGQELSSICYFWELGHPDNLGRNAGYIICPGLPGRK